MHLFARHPIARTHRADMVAPAFADTDAAQRGACDAAVIVWKLEVRCQLRRIVARAQS